MVPALSTATHRPILEAIKQRDAAATRKDVVHDVTDDQIATLGTTLKATEALIQLALSRFDVEPRQRSAEQVALR